MEKQLWKVFVSRKLTTLETSARVCLSFYHIHLFVFLDVFHISVSESHIIRTFPNISLKHFVLKEKKNKISIKNIDFPSKYHRNRNVHKNIYIVVFQRIFFVFHSSFLTDSLLLHHRHCSHIDNNNKIYIQTEQSKYIAPCIEERQKQIWFRLGGTWRTFLGIFFIVIVR